MEGLGRSFPCLSLQGYRDGHPCRAQGRGSGRALPNSGSPRARNDPAPSWRLSLREEISSRTTFPSGSSRSCTCSMRLPAPPGSSRRGARCGARGGRCASQCGSRCCRRRGAARRGSRGSHRGGSRRFPAQLPARSPERLPVLPPARHPPGVPPGAHGRAPPPARARAIPVTPAPGRQHAPRASLDAGGGQQPPVAGAALGGGRAAHGLHVATQRGALAGDLPGTGDGRLRAHRGPVPLQVEGAQAGFPLGAGDAPEGRTPLVPAAAALPSHEEHLEGCRAARLWRTEDARCGEAALQKAQVIPCHMLSIFTRATRARR